MTNPVILLGTMSNGETLPVQVDDTGRLVAEGLEGPPGAKGDEGPQGPEGPPGPAAEPVSPIKSIQHITAEITNANMFLNVAITPVDVAKTVIVNEGCFRDSYTAGEWAFRSLFVTELTSSQNIRIDRGENGVTMTYKFTVVEYS